MPSEGLREFVLKVYNLYQSNPDLVGGFFSGALTMLIFWAYVGSISYVYRDANARGKFGCLMALMVAMTGGMGLILWRIFRPGKIESR